MGFKTQQKQLTFSDLSKPFPDEKNRSLKTLMDLQNAVSWSRIESILVKDYPVGQKKEGNKAYPPMFLFKCLLLQKWFQIQSDPELENLINDRRSFRIFLGLPSDEPSPDHSTFSKFRKRLTKGKFDLMVGDILNQFSAQGLTINEGVAIDARIVKSASRPVSNKTLEKIRAKRETPEGQVDKNGNPLKYCRDIESNWTTKNKKHYYGLKEHTAVDAEHGFVLTTVLSPASVHDTNYFTYCTLYSRHIKHALVIVYADKGYAGEPNRTFLSMNKLQDGIMRKDTQTAKLTEYEIDRNKKISKVRYIVEQYFGLSHLQDNAQRARFTTIDKNNIDIWFRQVAFNIKRGLKIIQKQAVTA
ncbi:MAG: IS5 family transposase [Proteobacteria bacterium]|nr:IS5 family transposase [Pseudomonadota bacterium]MBU1543754.1 IS5 family transposase [Pseudomonadota bacterium]MBU2479904.1 IS5 family transposase [Pseudomonadota bacterium]